MHPLIPAFLGQALSSGAVQRDLMRAKPVERAAGKRGNELVQAFNERSKELAGDKAPHQVQIVSKTAPTGEELAQAFKDGDAEKLKEDLNSLNYAGNFARYPIGSDGKPDVLKGERKGFIVKANPNADEAYLAHELGHTASTNTAIGDAVRRARDFANSNPALATSVALAGGLTPMIAGALTPGDDDLDEAIIGSIALTTPALIDEALATKNALAIMEKSGQRANLAQRGRLAGGYLSYLAAPIMTGTLGNFIGNQFDENI